MPEVRDDEPRGTPVNHPPHYNAHPAGIECIDVIEHFNCNVANAMKYLWRAGLKSDDPLEDLKKAAWYVNREVERVGKERTTGSVGPHA